MKRLEQRTLLESAVQGLGVFIVALLGGVAAGASRHMFGFFANRRDRKFATKDALEQLLLSNLDEGRSLSIEYWSQDDTEETRRIAARIVALLDSLPELYIELFDSDTKVTRDLDLHLNNLQRAVTGGQFQQAGRKAQVEPITQMEVEHIALCNALRLARSKQRFPFL